MTRIKIKLKSLITSKEFLTLILALFVSITAYTLITLLMKAAGGTSVKGSQKMKKNRLLEQLEEIRLVDKNLSGAAKHSRLKGLLNQ